MACDMKCIPTRAIFTAMMSMGLAIIYGLRVNLSVAIVAMVNNTQLKLLHQQNSENYSVVDFACPAPESDSEGDLVQDGPFAWPEPVQGMVLGSYFWGYIVTQYPGGRIAEMFSAKWVVFGAVFTNGVFTIFTPIAAKYSYIGVLVVRLCEGLGAGVMFPAMSVMLTKWALPKESNLISSITYAGMAVGPVLSLPFSGLLADQFGWESIFYIQGALAVGWCLAWAMLVYDSPRQHPRIHSEELNLYITTMAAPTRSAKLPVPWKALLTSGPVWALLVAQVCMDFGWYMLLVELPTYMKNILRFNISQNSLLSAIPYLALWIFNLIFSNFLDCAKSKGWLTTTSVRKLANACTTLLPAACFIGVSLVGCDRQLAVLLMALGAMFMAGMFSGVYSNHIDVAPNYTGTIMAICNTASTVSGFAVPVFVGEMTHGNQTLDRWQIIFFTTAAILLLDFIVYGILASGEEQAWNRQPEDVNDPATAGFPLSKHDLTKEEESAQRNFGQP